ncbi:SusC/RagA family TonB-linked outer membrane protein [Sphingobacterium bovistauri]|uniref:TonB-dependent receptor n=1 Tax=Sphingobacterium bovistauri TaxID=2781959 RepID=A0ABS7Z7W3_9SPHI|nr:TonB-dependent receptor [Sphingobacterium bovistauri]MCA5006277.1 TonB-dependent receptor [Sphingobacterium bovistauri]
MIKYYKTLAFLCLANVSSSTMAKSVLNYENILLEVFQEKIVTGKVVDINNLPLSNVTITEIGTNNSTLTDNNGEFKLKLQSNSSRMMEVKFFNYEVKNVIIEKFDGNIIQLVNSETQLDEVVVVGFGTQKKVNLTGAVSTITAKELEARPVTSTVHALQGKLPGLTITQNSGQLYGKNPYMEVRGLSTIGQGSSGGVLVLIDGMEGDLYSINPQDIETISVLKDAAASSIYGSRAPFGVILVTTKSGKNKKATLNYNNNFHFNMPINLPHMADSYSWALYFNEASANDGKGADIGPERLKRIKDYIDGKIFYNTVPVGNQWGTAYTEGNDNINYYDVFYKNVTTAQEHNLSLNGGNETTNYFVSGNFLKQNGTLNWDLDGRKRYNVFGKIETKAFNFVDLKYNSRIIREDYHQPRVMQDDIFQNFGQYLWPVSPLNDPNGNLFNDITLRFRDGGQTTFSNTSSIHQVNATIQPLNGWRIVGDLNYRYRSHFIHKEVKKVHQIGIDGITPGSSWDDHSAVSEYGERNDFLNTNLYSDYERRLYDKHYFKIMGGFQAEQYHVRTLYAEKEGLIVPDIATINTTSGLFNGTQVPPYVSGDFNRWQTVGFFGRLNYNFDEKYLFEANLRYDGSSRFQQAQRWGLFPSFSAGYNLAKESFFDDARKYVNTLKIRASYGSLGNQNTHSYYPTYSAMGFANSAGTWLVNGQKPNIAWSPALISSSLTWEEIQSWNAGLDFGLFNDRLTGDFNYYIRKTLNMIGPADELPTILGTNVPNTNNTDLKSQGWELQIGWQDRAINNEFEYGVKLVLSDQVSTITRYSNPSQTLSRYYPGMKWGEIWGYESIDIARSQEEMENHIISLTNGGQNALGSNWQSGDVMYKDVNGDGKIDAGAYTISDHGDLKVLGNMMPRYSFGLDLNAAYKGVDVRVFLQGVGKREYFQGSKYFFGSRGWSKWGTMVLTQHLDYFRDEYTTNPMGSNVDAYYPRPYLDNTKNYQAQSLFLQNAAYMRVKNLQVGYSLPSNVLQTIGANRLRIFFTGENLFTFTKMTDLFDPETISSNDQGNVYPLSKTYAFGLSLTF